MFTFAMLYPKPDSIVRERKARKREQAKIYRIVCVAVSKRDGYKCRKCGERDGLHHHHLVFRSKGGSDTTRNLLLLCGMCHADVHGYRMTITPMTERGCDGALRFDVREV